MNALNKIALQRLHCWVNHSDKQNLIESKALEFELGQLGFRIQNADTVTSATREEFEEAIATLKEMRGGNVDYVPLFFNFPNELPNDHIYLLRRILGFFGLNTFNELHYGADPVTQMQREDLWRMAVAEQEKRWRDTHTVWIMLTAVSEQEMHQRLQQWAIDLVYGATPIKEALWDDILTVLSQLKVDVNINQIAIKETLARIAAHQWREFGKIAVKTPTDLLRIFAFLQGQDVSLATPVNLKGLKFSKSERRVILAFLNGCPSLAEDLLRYRRLWISISKWLHPGDYVYHFSTVVKAFDDLRNNRIKSFESKVINAPVGDRVNILLERPSVLLRKLTWLLKECRPRVVNDALFSLVTKINTLPLPLLMSVYCAIKYDGDVRAIVNKKGNPCVLKKRAFLGDVSDVLGVIDALILFKLRSTKDWSKVWIDPACDKLVLPLQARRQSDGLLNLARGSRISVDSQVLRLFVHWQQTKARTDLDLSAMRLGESFNFVEHIGWNRYGSGSDIVHSGDVQSSEFGATEFIDLRLTTLERGYIMPSIIRYAGEKFSELATCYAGWMNRKETGADTQAFDQKTVVQKVGITQDGQAWIPFLLDVAAKELVYVDLVSKGHRTIEKNAHFPLLAAAIASYWQAKPTFGALARWYVRANYAMLVDKTDAETTIGTTDDCTVNVLKLVGQGVTSF